MLKKGDLVTIYRRPLTQQDKEGEAKVVEVVNEIKGTLGTIYSLRVEFEPNFIVQRQVYLEHDEDADSHS